jgi:Tol biopolymer transport system component
VSRITDLGWVQAFASPDGQQVYFYAEGELKVVSIEGELVESIHKFDGEQQVTFFSPSKRSLAILDQPENGNLGDLWLISLFDNRSIQLDTNVNLSIYSGHLSEQDVTFSRDDHLIAYSTNEEDRMSLYVVDSDGRNRNRVSNDNAWLTFAFSPSGKQIAFVEGSRQNEPGNLYIADVDGNNRLELDEDVWSFRFSRNGRRIIYSKMDGLNRDGPKSEIYSIRPYGEGRELILEAQEGLISILALVND